MSATILQSASRPASARTKTSNKRRIAGRIITGLALAFLALDVVMKVARAKAAVDGTVQLGFAPHDVVTIGLIGAVCLVLYAIPYTAPLGAILWTGYFSGAIAVQLRLAHPLFSQMLFPIYVAVFVWGGLYLRDARVRALVHGTR